MDTSDQDDGLLKTLFKESFKGNWYIFLGPFKKHSYWMFVLVTPTPENTHSQPN